MHHSVINRYEQTKAIMHNRGAKSTQNDYTPCLATYALTSDTRKTLALACSTDRVWHLIMPAHHVPRRRHFRSSPRSHPARRRQGAAPPSGAAGQRAGRRRMSWAPRSACAGSAAAAGSPEAPSPGGTTHHPRMMLTLTLTCAPRPYSEPDADLSPNPGLRPAPSPHSRQNCERKSKPTGALEEDPTAAF